MAISPIAIATQGSLNSPLSIAAVRGHLTLAFDVPTGQTFPPGMRRKINIIREDDEIMAIIIAFLNMRNQ